MDSNQMELHFARVALDDALATGENQIFLSPSVLELEVVRRHVIYLADLQGVQLESNPLRLSNGAQIVFLQPGSRTSAGFSGHVYGINCFDGSSLADVSDLISSWTARKKHRAAFCSVAH